MASKALISSCCVAFRVDSSVPLGSGHVMRCLTLANELRRRGASVQFISRESPGHLLGWIEQEGHKLCRLPAADVEVSAPQDLVETKAALGASKPDWFIVDHYALAAAWERGLRPHVGRMLVIEDLAGRTHDCDVLLDQNWSGADDENRHSTSVPAKCLRLLGPRFALLQSEYAQCRNILPPRDGSVRRVMVYFGGSDPTDETGKALDALSAPEFAHLAVDVVIGTNCSRREEIAAKVSLRGAATLHERLASLAGLMVRSDFFVGAGGSTTWERICLGLPALVTTLAANQEPGTAALDKAGILSWIGRSTATTSDDYRRALDRNISRNSLMAGRAPPLVDGYGAKRVAEVVLPSTPDALSLRNAAPQDAVLFFDWRNDPTVRAMSFVQEPISWSAHVDWFRRRLDDLDTRLHVAEVDGLPIGQLRFDFGGGEAVLSYSVDRLARGQGWGRCMISAAVARSDRARRMGIAAFVKAENAASRSVFTQLGWSESSSDAESVVFRWAAGKK